MNAKGKSLENHRKAIGKPLDNHGKTTAKPLKTKEKHSKKIPAKPELSNLQTNSFADLVCDMTLANSVYTFCFADLICQL